MTSNYKAKNKNCAGTVIVEVAIACIVVLMLILGILDFSRMHFSQSRLQYAVSQSTRFATIGNALTDPSSGKPMSRQASIIHMIRTLSRLGDLQDSDIKITALNAASGKTADGPGNPGDVVTVRATYRVPLIAPYLAPAFKNHRYEFTCGTSYRNEEFAQ